MIAKHWLLIALIAVSCVLPHVKADEEEETTTLDELEQPDTDEPVTLSTNPDAETTAVSTEENTGEGTVAATTAAATTGVAVASTTVAMTTVAVTDGASSTPVQSTTPPQPTQSEKPKRTASGGMNLAGNFKEILDDPEKAEELKESLEEDIKGAIGADEVNITEMRLGSLIVKYTFTTSLTTEETAARIEEVTSSGNLDWLANTVAVYVEVNGADSLTELAALSFEEEAVTPDSGSESQESFCGGGCVAGIVIGSVAAVGLIGVALYFLSRNTIKKTGLKNEPIATETAV